MHFHRSNDNPQMFLIFQETRSIRREQTMKMKFSAAFNSVSHFLPFQAPSFFQATFALNFSFLFSEFPILRGLDIHCDLFLLQLEAIGTNQSNLNDLSI